MKKAWGESGAKVLFVDVDETMIHCIDDRDPPTMKGRIKLTINLENYEEPTNAETPDTIDIFINERPGLRDCLNNLKNAYQIVAFTASNQLYADTILDFLDPDNQIFSARLYRQHCVNTQFGLIKDLRIIANR